MDPTRALALNPPLSTARLLLEPLEERHAELLFEPMQDEAIYTWISMDPPPSVDALRESWRELARTRLSPDGTGARLDWAVRLSSGAYVGKLDASARASGVADNVGYLFFPPFWGRGYATEAVSALTQRMVQLGVGPLHATVTRGNDASGRVLEKCGYRFTRILPDNDLIRGVRYDDLEYVHPGAR